MAHPFDIRVDVEIDATPEQVWEAITTGPGMDGWWMGRNEVEGRAGGTVRTSFADFDMESVVATWDPPHRFVTSSGETPDGRVMSLAFEIEGRAGGRTALRVVHSGFLPDEGWEDEYEGLKEGDPAYIQKLVEYLEHFRGRIATPITASGPRAEAARARAIFARELGLSEPIALGDPARIVLDDEPPVDGVVDYLTPSFLGVRTADGMYRFIRGYDGSLVLGHHVFATVDRGATERAWQAWLDRAFAEQPAR